jgi:acetyltransferase-like isoleucine patch superfamily enzyme
LNTMVRYAMSLLPNGFKIFLMRRKGKIGRGVNIGLGSVIVAPRIEIGDYSRIGTGTHIVAESVKIGKRVWIGHRNQIRTNVLEMADDSEITNDVTIGGMDSPRSRLSLGERSSIMAYSFVNTTYPVEIGKDVGVGGYCKLFTHGSWQSILDGYPMQFGPVTIEDNVWIPWDVFIMPNVTIGSGSTIGARSLVTKSIPPYSLVVGIPAKVIRQAPDYPLKRNLDQKAENIENIVGEMKEYFAWKGWPLEVEHPEKFSWSLSGESKIHGESDTVKITLASTKGELPRGWIDLENRVDKLDLRNSWEHEICSFLGRYGIRTEHIG